MHRVTWKQWTGGRIHRLREFRTERGAAAFVTRLLERLDVSDVRRSEHPELIFEISRNGVDTARFRDI